MNFTVSHLHNAIPVVPGGYPEQQEESHAKILECGITAKTFTGVQLITYWDRNKMSWSEVHGLGMCTSTYFHCYEKVHTLNEKLVHF